MLVSFEIKFIRRDQKQRRNGEACRAIQTCFWPSLINLISKDMWYSIYHALLADLIAKDNETNRKQFYSDLISQNVIIPLLSGEFCSRCMINLYFV